MERLGDLMVGRGLATEEQRAHAFLIYRREGGRFGTALLESGVPEAAIAAALGIQHNVASAGGAELEEIKPEVLRLVSIRSAQRLGLIPFQAGGARPVGGAQGPEGSPGAGRDRYRDGPSRSARSSPPRPGSTRRSRSITVRASSRGTSERFASPSTGSRPPGRTPSATEPSTAPRRARPATIRIIHPPTSGGRSPIPPSIPAPAAARIARPSATTRDRTDPWASTDPRGTAAVLPLEQDFVEDAFRSATPEPSPPMIPEQPEPSMPDDLVPDGPAPTVEERLAEELGEATTNEDVIDAVLTAAGHYVRRAALFVVQGDYVAGWGARPDPPGELREFRLPLAEASVFATLRDTEGFYVGTYMDLPTTVRVLRALGSDGLGTMAVVPVTLKGKTVLYIWGESESYTRPPSVPALKRLAAMMATGLEIVRLKSRLFAL